MWLRGSLLGLTVLDRDRRLVGVVDGTYPLDGSSAEFAVVRLGRFGARTLVPLQGARAADDVLQVPYTLDDIDASPSLDRSRYEDDSAEDSLAYWGTQRPEGSFAAE